MAKEITEEELSLLEQCKTAEEWKRATLIVKESHGGEYPSDWWAKVKQSGIMERVFARWGESPELKTAVFKQPVPFPVSPTTVLALAAKHVRHFESLCRRAIDGESGIRFDECIGLLKIWRSVVDSDGKELAPDELREVQDAIDSGDFDTLIPEAELKAYEEWIGDEPVGQLTEAGKALAQELLASNRKETEN